MANAISHGNPQGPVEVIAQVNAGTFELTVKNLGLISEQAMPLLFQPYSRPTGALPQAGLGLGLYIVKQIADAHGGRLEVSSHEQDGTVFSFSLPAGD